MSPSNHAAALDRVREASSLGTLQDPRQDTQEGAFVPIPQTHEAVYRHGICRQESRQR